LQTLLSGPEEETGEPNWPLRHQLELVELTRLQAQLQKLNPELFERLNGSDRQNKRRLIRWIEKLTLSKEDLGFKPSPKPWASGFTLDFRGRRFTHKEELAQKIHQRVTERVAAGALAEVEILLSMGYQEADPGLQTIGYQQLLKHSRGECSLKEVVKEWETKEMQYAKRQLTFMKKNPQIVWELL
jgi:tRNA dimethylallyltransferase